MSQKLNDITFLKGQGGSGRVANGSDFISGLMFFNNTRPLLFPDNFSTGGVHQVFSLNDAVALGITNNYSDETKSTSTVQVTNAGADGDTIEIDVLEWVGGLAGKGNVKLGVYKKITADNTPTLVAVGIAAAINAGTSTHGYTATSSTDTVTITARPGMGVYLNTGSPYTKVIVGTIAATIVQNVVPGVYSKLAVYYYHIKRFFAAKADAFCYVGIFNTANSETFTDIANMMNASGDSMVQMGIWDDTEVFETAALTAIQTQLDALEAVNSYLSSVVYAADIKAISGTALADLAGGSYNLANLTARKVTALIDNDGGGAGLDLFYQVGKTISSLGCAIGSIAEAAISEDIGNSRFNADDGVEFDTLMFGDGTFYKTVAQSQLDQLNNNRFLFLSKIKNQGGLSVYSDDHTSIAYTSDYAYIHDNRIIDRVIKDSFSVLVPTLKARLKLKADGTMTAQTIASLIATVGNVISPLIASGDLAGDPDNFDASKFVLISQNQKPNVTGKLVIGIKLGENAIAHSIFVPIGFGTV